MRVRAEPYYKRIDEDQDREETCQDRLDDNQDDADDRLRGLRDPELFYEDEDADDRQRSHNLNDDVDPVARPEAVWSRE